MRHKPPLPGSLLFRLPAWLRQAWQRADAEPFAGDTARMALAIYLAAANMRHGMGGPFGAALFEERTGSLLAGGAAVAGHRRAVRRGTRRRASRAARLRGGGRRDLQPGARRAGGAYFRSETAASNPIMTSVVTRLLPPWLISGSVMPVSGSALVTPATLSTV